MKLIILFVFISVSSIKGQNFDTIKIKRISYSIDQQFVDTVQLIVSLKDVANTTMLFISAGFFEDTTQILTHVGFEVKSSNGTYYIEYPINNKLQKAFFIKNQIIFSLDLKKLQIKELNYLLYYYSHQIKGYSDEILINM
jgi:hypothetical protein